MRPTCMPRVHSGQAFSAGASSRTTIGTASSMPLEIGGSACSWRRTMFRPAGRMGLPSKCISIYTSPTREPRMRRRSRSSLPATRSGPARQPDRESSGTRLLPKLLPCPWSAIDVERQVHVAGVEVAVQVQRGGDAGVPHDLLQHLWRVFGLDHE